MTPVAVNLAQSWIPTIKASLDQWRQEDANNNERHLRQQRQLDQAARDRAHSELLNALAEARAREEERHAEVMGTMQALRDKMAAVEGRQNNLDAYLTGLTLRLNTIAARVFPDEVAGLHPSILASPPDNQGEAPAGGAGAPEGPQVQGPPDLERANVPQNEARQQVDANGEQQEHIDHPPSDAGEEDRPSSTTLPTDASSASQGVATHQPGPPPSPLFLRSGSSELSASPLPIRPPRGRRARPSLVSYSSSGSEGDDHSGDDDAPMNVDETSVQ